MLSLYQRPRRNRRNEAIRNLVQENRLTTSDLIYPLFISELVSGKEAVGSMPGIFRHDLDSTLREIERAMELGIKAFVLFPAIKEEHKDSKASASTNQQGLYLRAIQAIKERFPTCWLISDVAMDPYSSDGHDGLVNDGEIINDESVEILAEMALAQAQAGIDMVGPSDMMDGRVGAIREELDDNGFENVGIMSYTAKYASAFYGPFRDALGSAPKAGDKKTYQMNPANGKEAELEADLDEAEGADILMVKPGLPYLDIVYRLKENTSLPIAAYHVSGEYAMLKAASEKGWIDYEAVMMESLLSFKRAGCSMILTYCACDAAKLLRMG